jgi:ADP-ribosylglycohydrolase
MPGSRARIDRDRARGALLGLAVGDALGTTLEFGRPEVPPFPARLDGPHREITGGGPFDLVAGQVTDDTQMAACLAASLVARGRYDAADAAARYVAWSHVAFDAGAQTRAALAAVEAGARPLQAGRAVWLAADGRRPAGNGSLMRTAPLGVRFAHDGRARASATLRDSAITHFDPRCQLACVALNGAIATALLRRPAEPIAVIEGAVADVVRGATLLARSRSVPAAERREAVRAIHEDLNLALEADPRLRGGEADLHEAQGFVRVALRLAFWELVHAPTFEAGLVDVVNRGGDADTNGAVAGALLGACWGEGAIPARWRRAVLEAPPGRLGPDADRWHPRHLLALVDGG